MTSLTKTKAIKYCLLKNALFQDHDNVLSDERKQRIRYPLDQSVKQKLCGQLQSTKLIFFFVFK